MTRLAALAAVCSVAALAAAPGARADPRPPSGADWRRHCDAYLTEVGGGAKADDLAVTYCIGLTSGVLAGLKLGAQLGALGMASRLTVNYKLDSQEVFELFKQTTPEALMQVCPPKSIALHDYIATVHEYLTGHADAATRPLPDVFFEALHDRYPCDAAPPGAKP